MKNLGNVAIIGDSYSTFAGYIPENYRCYYGTERTSALKTVDETWWYDLLERTGSRLILNDSFSGSTICNTCRDFLSVDTSFVSRVDSYIEKNYFAKN